MDAAQVGFLIDQRMMEVYASLRKGSEAFAARVDAIKNAISGKCDADTSTDTTHLEIPVHIAATLDALRMGKRGAVFDRLVLAAEAVIEADPMMRTQATVEAMEALLKAA